MFTKSIFGLSAVLALLVAVGCRNTQTPTTQAAMPATPQQAVVISGGNSGIGTVIFIPTADPGKPMMLCTSGTNLDACPECEAAAVKYFRTGVLDPKCSRTGALRTLGTLTTPTIGHQ